MAHRPEPWKQGFLARLHRKSYQQNLLDRNQTDGLDFELEGYTGNTLHAMRSWRLGNFPEVLQLKLENIISNFDGSMEMIFRHFNFSEEECQSAIDVSRAEDVSRMSDREIAANAHIHSRKLSKWREFLSPGQLEKFERRYGDLISGLGYDL